MCVCKVCDKEYTPKAANRTTVCSRECGFEWHRRVVHPKRQAEYEATRVAKRLRALFASLKACSTCGLGFKARKGQVSCSQCSTATKTCALCNKPRAKAGRYLSRYCAECRTEALKASRKKARWGRDRKQDHATAKYQSKELLLLLRGLVRRAKGQCRLCGLAMSKRCDPNSDRA
jgi:hypothetical protein